MPTFRLRVLRHRHACGGVDVHMEWLEAKREGDAVAQAKLIVTTILSGGAGIAMLSTDQEFLCWSFRQHMPKPPELM